MPSNDRPRLPSPPPLFFRRRNCLTFLLLLLLLSPRATQLLLWRPPLPQSYTRGRGTKTLSPHTHTTPRRYTQEAPPPQQYPICNKFGPLSSLFFLLLFSAFAFRKWLGEGKKEGSGDSLSRTKARPTQIGCFGTSAEGGCRRLLYDADASCCLCVSCYVCPSLSLANIICDGRFDVGPISKSVRPRFSDVAKKSIGLSRKPFRYHFFLCRLISVRFTDSRAIYLVVRTYTCSPIDVRSSTHTKLYVRTMCTLDCRRRASLLSPFSVAS